MLASTVCFLSVTLNQILMLAGRLEDGPGFDTPCQRFRRFLTECVSDISTARAFIEECGSPHDEDHRRALQDLVVLLGRFLGFETVFGSYQPLVGVLRYDGHWRSRGHLEVILEVRTDRATIDDMSSLSRSVAALAATSRVPNQYRAGPLASDTQVLGLCVCTSIDANGAYVGRVARSGPGDGFGDAAAARTLRLVSLRSLLALAEMASSGQLTHEDVLQLVESSVRLDIVVDLLERSSRPARESSSSSPSEPREARFWFATVVGQGESPEHLIESAVGQGVFNLSTSATPQHGVQPGDWLCFCIPGRGVVGHGEIAFIDGDGSDRGRHRGVTQVCRLRHVALYVRTPVIPDFQTQLRLTAAHRGSDPTVPALLSISREEFGELTRRDEGPAVRRLASL